MGNVGSAIGNFFKNDIASLGNAFEGLGGILGTTIGGLFGGGFNYSNAIGHLKRYGEDVAGAFTDRSINISSDINPSDPPSASDLYQNMISATNVVNSNLSKISSTNSYIGSSGVYSPSGLGSSILPPSNLMKISDPTTKMAIASSRGSMRNVVNVVGKQFDLNSASDIGAALSSSGDGSQPTDTSQNTDSGAMNLPTV